MFLFNFMHNLFPSIYFYLHAFFFISSPFVQLNFCFLFTSTWKHNPFCIRKMVPILDAFAKLRKVTTSFVISVYLSVCCPSVRPFAQNNSAPTGRTFTVRILIFEHFQKICRKNSSFIKFWQEELVLYVNSDMYLLLYLIHSFLEW